MSLETGDIAINTSWPGHVMMVYEGHDIVDKVSIIHGTNSGNFHISKNMTEDAQHRIGYLVDTPTWVFRPPWQNLGHGAAIKKRELQANAKKVSESAKYGKGRAVRLFLGSSEFGSDAVKRLAKYRDRMLDYRPGGKLISTITCSEAVIISYQLTFFSKLAPFFILKDAAHTMPSTLKDWLELNWETVKKGT